MYIVDDNNERVMKWAPGATEGTVVAGGNGRGSANNQFDGIFGIALDTSNNIYVSDWNNHRIMKWEPNASQGTGVAGGNGGGYSNDQLKRTRKP